MRSQGKQSTSKSVTKHGRNKDNASHKTLLGFLEESASTSDSDEIQTTIVTREQRRNNNIDNDNNTTEIPAKKRKRMIISDDDDDDNDGHESDNNDTDLEYFRRLQDLSNFEKIEHNNEDMKEKDDDDYDDDRIFKGITKYAKKSHCKNTGFSESHVSNHTNSIDSITMNNHDDDGDDDWHNYYNTYDTPIPNFPLPNYIHLQTDDITTTNNNNNNNNNNGRLSANSSTISVPSSIKLLTCTDKSTLISHYIDNNQPPLLDGQKIKDLNEFKFSQKNITKKMGPYDDSLILHNNTFQFKVIHIENSKIIDVIISDCRTHQLYLINDQRLMKGWTKTD